MLILARKPSDFLYSYLFYIRTTQISFLEYKNIKIVNTAKVGHVSVTQSGINRCIKSDNDVTIMKKSCSIDHDQTIFVSPRVHACII
jgi:hypothetical protein